MLSLRQALSLNTIRNLGVVYPNEYSCEFDGVDDSVIVAQSAALRPTDELSISLWMKPTTWNMTGASHKQYVFGCVRSGGWGIKLENNGSGHTTLRFEIKTVSSGYIYAVIDKDTTEAFTGWKNIIATYNESSGLAKIYHNGSTTGTTNGTATAGDTIGYHASPLPIFIGADAASATAGSDFFEGSVDEFSVFNIELSPDTISRISDLPTDLTDETGLVGWWRMGDPNGTSSYPTIVDASSNTNNGTMDNMIAADITTDVPTP